MNFSEMNFNEMSKGLLFFGKKRSKKNYFLPSLILE